MKKFIFFYFVFILFIITSYFSYKKINEYFFNNKYLYKTEDKIYMSSKIENNKFYVYKNSKWKEITIKGVNMGLGIPGSFPGEYSIDKETYLRWFKDIKNMNANVIRVYTLQSPEFYSALYDYNHMNKDPLYVIHGVWVNEDLINSTLDAFHDNIIRLDYEEEAKNIINAIHGNATIEKKSGKAWGTYNKDVSKYIIGWIAGIEFSADFVNNTNKNNNIKDYDGKYFSINDAEPFDVFLTQFEDYITTYEMDKYSFQRPIAISNWLTTDPLNHPNEPIKELEDSAVIDAEKIKVNDYKAGVFASYHIYPYYPDFLNYDLKYIQKDDNGNIDTYLAYLKELTEYHKMPILVSEVGLSTSRGVCHSAVYSGYNQGGLTEREQGEYLSNLIDDILSLDTLGFIIFSWQDEWFKSSWNTMDYDNPAGRSMWLNTQTAEENFGLLSFDLKDKVTIDGMFNEWSNKDKIINNEDYTLSVKEDSSYLYLLIDVKKDYSFDEDEILIGIDTLNNSGNEEYNSIKFNKYVDFILSINGKNNTKVLVDSYYDPFYYTYAVDNKIISRDIDLEIKNSGNFNSINLMLNRPLFLPETEEKIETEVLETGLLKYGNSDNLSDFYYKNNKIELRIPWNVLNFSNPIENEIIDNLYENKGIYFTNISNISIGIGNEENENIDLVEYKLKSKNLEYNERLKDSYYILKEKFNEI